MTSVLIIVLHWIAIYMYMYIFLLYEQFCYIIYMWTTLSESTC